MCYSAAVGLPDHRRRHASYDDILALPDHVVGELIDGELYVSPRPAPRHVVASSALGAEIWGPYHGGRGGPGGWWILDEPELHFGPDVVVPDLAGWRRAHMPAVPDTAYFTVAPDWVCEVLSPSTSRLDRATKLRVYAREGVAHAWLLDPLQRTLEVLRLERSRWVILSVRSNDDVVRAEPFDATELSLKLLWVEDAGSP